MFCGGHTPQTTLTITNLGLALIFTPFYAIFTLLWRYAMTQQAELLKEIEKNPQKYFGEVIDFLGYIQHKAQQEANNIEQEEHKANIQLSKDSNGKFILTKEVLDEMLRNSPNTRALSGILSGLGDVDLDKVRMERLDYASGSIPAVTPQEFIQAISTQ